jgi:hypothetical protein
MAFHLWEGNAKLFLNFFKSLEPETTLQNSKQKNVAFNFIYKFLENWKEK